MFEELLAYFNHPLLVDPYIRFVVIITTFAVIAAVVSFLVNTVGKKIAAKTKTEADDVILKKTQKPIVYLILAVGIGIAITSLGLTEGTSETISHVMNTFYILITIYIIATVADILIEVWGKAWAAKTESTLDDELIPLFHKATGVVSIIAALMLVLSEWQYDITGLIAGIGVAGLAIGFAVKDSLANIFGGLSIILDREFKVGDIIELADGTSGAVVDIGLRSTRIRTWDNELIIIPNGGLANSKVLNKKLPDLSARATVDFGVEYGADVEKVKNIVMKALLSIDDIVKEGDRAPRVLMMSMGASALEFKAFIWVDDYSKRFAKKEEATVTIYNALNKAGIVIPYQTFTVYNKKE